MKTETEFFLLQQQLNQSLADQEKLLTALRALARYVRKYKLSAYAPEGNQIEDQVNAVLSELTRKCDFCNTKARYLETDHSKSVYLCNDHAVNRDWTKIKEIA